MPRDWPEPSIDDVELGAVLGALADPHRRRVIVELARAPAVERACASFSLPLAKSTKTHHWRVLREAGLIHQRDAGNGMHISLRREEIDRRFPGLLDTIAQLGDF
jgi:DNA-binding transcriptional ArsR family regulator